MKVLIPAWESHMAEREARDRPGCDPQWWIHVDSILRIRRVDVYSEYVIETRDKLRYYVHKELFGQLITEMAES